MPAVKRAAGAPRPTAAKAPSTVSESQESQDPRARRLARIRLLLARARRLAGKASPHLCAVLDQAVEIAGRQTVG